MDWKEEKTRWLKEFCDTVLRVFGRRVEFIGIQGSYGRDEEGPGSDIDVVVILEEVTYKDLVEYDLAISRLTKRDRICGFLSGRRELENWNRADLFQFCRDTKPLYGSLEWLSKNISEKDAAEALKIGACNLYHMCVHNSVHEKDPGLLKELYKGARFLLQAKYFLQTGRYIEKKKDLLQAAEGADREILETLVSESWKDDFGLACERLLSWSSGLICWKADREG